MDKATLNHFKDKLETERTRMVEELQKIAAPKDGMPGKWEATFAIAEDETGHAAEERQEDDLEEFETRVSLTATLEKQLGDIDLALEKIEKGIYGKCENCRANIPLERLEIYPEARLCFGCDKGNK